MVEMSDISRQQKLASAKKKLKKFQQAKSPVSNGPSKENLNLSQEILHGLQNNHIFKTPPLSVSKNEVNRNNSPPSNNSTNQRLNIVHDSPAVHKTNNQKLSSPSELFGGPNDSKHPDANLSITNGHGNISSAKTISDSEQAIASYKRSNQQLANQVGEQRKQILQLQEKLKETSASAQKVLDQRALKEQLEVHIQTIGILVSEKSELQSNLATVQKKLSNKDNEITELNHVLKTTQNRLVDFEKTVHEMKNMEGNLQKSNKEVVTERDRISTRLYEISHEKEELNLQNSELQSKLQMKINESDTLSKKLNELHVKLQRGENNVQQDQNNSQWQQEKENLSKTIEEQKVIVERLVADKAELLQKNNDTQSHYEYQIDELKTQINKIELERSSLLDQSRMLSENLQDVQQQLSLKEASDDVSGRKIDNTIPATPTLQNDQQEKQLEKIQEEKQSVEQELDIQIQENRRLSRLTLEQTGKIEELESNLSRLQSESVDKSSLLEQIQSDKETVSRALQQNKILKEQLVELEEGFVKMSNSSADLTTKLETEQYGSKEMAEKFSSVKIELEETKVKLLERSRACDELSEELQKFKTELYTAQMKLATKEMDSDSSQTEVETSQREPEYQISEQRNAASDISEKDTQETHRLREQLRTAEETIEHLNIQNDQLQTSLRNIYTKQNEEQTGHRFAQPEGGYSEDDTTTEEEEHDFHSNDVIQDGEEGVVIGTPLRGTFDESTTTTTDEFDEENAIRVSRNELANLQKTLSDLQEERQRILDVLQQEREKSFSASERLEEHVELKVQQLATQRERELQEHFYEQTEALQKKVQSLHEALEIMRKNEDIADFDMTSDGITMPLLKTAFMQLQKRYKSAMDAKANLSDRIEQLEHMNMRLESETDSIGEYIALYQSQRQAMKEKFAEKDDIIQRISNEHGRMQNKVSQLHQLVMQMLCERSGFESKNKQLQELVNRRLAIQTGESSESEVPKLQYNLDNLFGEITVTPEDENELIKDNISVTDEIRRDSITAISDQTAQQILNIFEQLETTGEGYQHGWLSPAARKHSFLPCQNCSGELLSL